MSVRWLLENEHTISNVFNIFMIGSSCWLISSSSLIEVSSSVRWASIMLTKPRKRSLSDARNLWFREKNRPQNQYFNVNNNRQQPLKPNFFRSVVAHRNIRLLWLLLLPFFLMLLYHHHHHCRFVVSACCIDWACSIADMASHENHVSNEEADACCDGLNKGWITDLCTSSLDTAKPDWCKCWC